MLNAIMATIQWKSKSKSQPQLKKKLIYDFDNIFFHKAFNHIIMFSQTRPCIHVYGPMLAPLCGGHLGFRDPWDKPITI